MASPLILQALELNNLIWKYGPYVRYPVQWNSEKGLFEPEKSCVRNLIWFCTSVVPFGFVFLLLLFLVIIGLKAPHLDRLPNWIATFELLPLATYVFIRNWKAFTIGPTDVCKYFNNLMHMSMLEFDQQGNLAKGSKLKAFAKRKKPWHFAVLLMKGKF